MFKVIKLKPILITIAMLMVSILLSVGIVSVVESREVPKPIYTIVIDAGHGGRDDGCVSDNGTIESEINLKIAKTLKNYLETLGIKVVLTRSDGNGLYDSNATNFKVSDMEKRIEIIQKTKPNMVISIHCNSFEDRSQRGAQVFYQENDEVSKEFECEVAVEDEPKVEKIDYKTLTLKELKKIAKEKNVPIDPVTLGHYPHSS